MEEHSVPTPDSRPIGHRAGPGRAGVAGEHASSFGLDLRLVLRRQWRAPGFCGSVLLILALGIGAAMALVSLLNAIVLRPLPIEDPDRVVTVSRVNDQGQLRFMPVTTVAEFARGQRAFSAVAAYAGGAVFPIEANGALASMPIELVNEGYYPVLGIKAAVGRVIDATDRPSAIDAATVVVLTHSFWQRRYGGDPAAIGQELRIDGVPFTIVGVTPRGFFGMQAGVAADVTIPIAGLERLAGRTPSADRPPQASHILARLGPDVSLDAARVQVDALWPGIQAATVPPNLTPEQRADALRLRPVVEPGCLGFSLLRADVSSTLYLLTGFAMLLLLLTCVNLGGMLLVRVASRETEIAVRTALGASRRHILQSVVVESLVLSIGGTLLALPLAWWAAGMMGAALWAGVPATVTTAPDARVLIAAGGVALLTGLLIGVVPAWFAAGRLAGAGLTSARTVTQSGSRWSRQLLIGQVALSLALVFGAGVLGRSLANLYRADPGFDADDLLLARVNAQPGAYRNLASAVYYPELLRRLSGLPGRPERVVVASAVVRV